MSVYEELKYFREEEFAPHAEKMSEELLQRLDAARSAAGVPFVVTSGYRDDKGAHGKGKAADVRCRGSWERMEIVKGMIGAGFPRVGVYDLHVHGDVDEELPKGMWAGVSS